MKKLKGERVENKNAVFKMRLVKKLDKSRKKAFILKFVKKKWIIQISRRIVVYARRLKLKIN